MYLKRFIYLGYYIKQLDRLKLKQFLEYSSKETGRSRISLLSDMLTSVFRYNISLLEYFQFRFFEIPESQRERWVGTGYMYEYQLEMNPVNTRQILDDKRLFNKNYSEFFVHRVASLEDLSDENIAREMLNLPSGKLVFKEPAGKCGAQVEIKESRDFTAETLVPFMNKNNYGMVEEFIQQHSELNRLSPSAVNTVRIITQISEEDEVEILGCRLRISINSSVDNMAAGNMAAPIDENTGKVSGPGVFGDVDKENCYVHPVTGVEIPGFKIPFWDEIIKMVKNAALKHPQNRSIGWDVVVTEKGPGLIEGNHDWCKLVWQLPVKKGLKPNLDKHINLSDENRFKNRKSLKNIEHVEAGI